MLNLAFSSMLCCCDCPQFNKSGIRCIYLDEVSAFPDIICSCSRQATCKIAGRNINVALIQNLVLGCNMHCPGQV
uniref:Uncharacterized protein n=1 Tax=Aegilops tauschii subsp. strangulata TaxID=200361 RepID=A0A453BWQ5_AEGTS